MELMMYSEILKVSTAIEYKEGHFIPYISTAIYKAK